MELDVASVEQQVSTGPPPASQRIDELLVVAYEHAQKHREGVVADYIPVLAQADPEAFGLCVTGVDGGVHEHGDTRIRFSIQSISKAFVYALVCEEIGHERVLDVVGVNNTGLAFNSVVAIELNDGHPMTNATPAQVDAAVALNEEARLSALRIGLLILAGVSVIAIVPASRLPNYRPGEIPESVASGESEAA